MSAHLVLGDCLNVLARLPDAVIDAVVTDPPYHLQSISKRFANSPRSEKTERYAEGPYGRHAAGFMGKSWDGGDISFNPAAWEAVLRVLKPGGHLLAFGGTRTHHRIWSAIEDAGFEVRDTVFWVYGSGFPKSHDAGGGWGTALKPAIEPIVLARKPLIGTVAANVALFGTGAINIDACRTEEKRWPANLVHDGSAEVVAAFPAAPGQPRFFYCAKASRSDRDEGCETLPDQLGGMRSETSGQHITRRDGGAPGQVKNDHPTVKPTALMRWLVRLVTPPNGLILDPFTGSGSTGKAALIEGFRFLGIEKEAPYLAIAEKRIAVAGAVKLHHPRKEHAA